MKFTKIIKNCFCLKLNLSSNLQKSLQTDVRVAWTQINLPEAVKRGEQVDDWWPLTGKLGEELEGTIHMVLSKKVSQIIVRYFGFQFAELF